MGLLLWWMLMVVVIGFRRLRKTTVYWKLIMHAAGEHTQVLQDVAADPTLPRTKSVRCSVCNHPEAVFFQKTFTLRRNYRKQVMSWLLVHKDNQERETIIAASTLYDAERRRIKAGPRR